MGQLSGQRKNSAVWQPEGHSSARRSGRIGGRRTVRGGWPGQRRPLGASTLTRRPQAHDLYRKATSRRLRQVVAKVSPVATVRHPAVGCTQKILFEPLVALDASTPADDLYRFLAATGGDRSSGHGGPAEGLSLAASRADYAGSPDEPDDSTPSVDMYGLFLRRGWLMATGELDATKNSQHCINRNSCRCIVSPYQPERRS
jgi:hypothetical protein